MVVKNGEVEDCTFRAAVEQLTPESGVPSFDVAQIAGEVHTELLNLFGFEPRPSSVKLIFGVQSGYVRPEGIYLPSEFPPGPGYSTQDNFRVYLKHELVHYLLQIEYRVNPMPPSFINEGVAQSLAEGRGPVLRPIDRTGRAIVTTRKPS